MADPRLALAVGLAALTLALFVAVIAVGGALRAGLAPWPGIAVVVMGTAALAMSGRHSRPYQGATPFPRQIVHGSASLAMLDLLFQKSRTLMVSRDRGAGGWARDGATSKRIARMVHSQSPEWIFRRCRRGPTFGRRKAPQ